MARYIDADKFLEAQKDRCEGRVLIGNCTSNNNYLEYELEKYIAEDVQPVIHAKATDYYYCSNCQYPFNLEDVFEFNYCPSCGAKMDKR